MMPGMMASQHRPRVWAHGGHHHDHDHGHAHSHHHDHEEEADGGPKLPRGVGGTLVFDAQSGVAGDMTVAALIDLGVPLAFIRGQLGTLGLEGYHTHVSRTERSGISAVLFDVHVDKGQPERTWSSIDAMLESARLDGDVRTRARAIFKRLGESEARVHRMPMEKVHFHEVGGVDAIVDIVGAAAGLAYLDASTICLPLPLGRGFVKARHGTLPLPAPATLACLEGIPTYGVDLDSELVTPTGAAIVGAMAHGAARWPAGFRPSRTGFGAGHRELADRPNVLRLVLGTTDATDAVGVHGTHVMVEATVDDMTGELAGAVLDALRDAGALDAWLVPVQMKKGRPGWVISAVAPASKREAVTARMLSESTSIGVRTYEVSRIERPRESVSVQTAYGPIRVKVSAGPFGAPQVKPEFDDCVAAASKHAVPVRVVMAAAMAVASRS